MMNRSSLARPRLHRYDRLRLRPREPPGRGLLLGAVVALGTAVSIALGFAVAQAPSAR